MIPSIDWSIEIYLSISGLVVGLGFSIYLFYEWLKHRRKQPHLLLWAVGLALFYIFLIPFILANFGESIILTEWINFLTYTIPLIFLGWVFVYWGIAQMKFSATGTKSPKLTISLTLWVIASFIFYYFRFSSTEYGKVLSIIGILAFFITIHILILSALRKWFKAERRQKNMLIDVGIIFITVAIVFSIVRYLIVLSRLIQLPQAFYFLSIANFDIVFILRSIVIILLAIGFVLVCKCYLPKSGI